MSSLDKTHWVLLAVSMGTYRHILAEAQRRGRSPDDTSDELVNEALDRIRATTYEPLSAIVPPAPAIPRTMPGTPLAPVVPVLAPPVDHLPTLRSGGRPVPCAATPGPCGNPLYWRGSKRCGCPASMRAHRWQRFDR